MSPIYTNGWDYSFSDFFPMLDSGEGYGREKNVETVKEKETSLEWIPGRRFKSKLEPLYFLLWVVKIVPNARGKLAWQSVSIDFSSAQMEFGV